MFCGRHFGCSPHFTIACILRMDYCLFAMMTVTSVHLYHRWAFVDRCHDVEVSAMECVHRVTANRPTAMLNRTIGDVLIVSIGHSAYEVVNSVQTLKNSEKLVAETRMDLVDDVHLQQKNVADHCSRSIDGLRHRRTDANPGNCSSMLPN